MIVKQVDGIGSMSKVVILISMLADSTVRIILWVAALRVPSTWTPNIGVTTIITQLDPIETDIEILILDVCMCEQCS